MGAIQEGVKVGVAKAAPGEWITGGQWDASAIGRIPDRAMLDAVAPRNPVWLHDTSGHSTWANSKALEAAGISRKTPDPEGGIIERDARGEPTGIQRETANGLIQAHGTAPSAHPTQARPERALQALPTPGLTAFP